MYLSVPFTLFAPAVTVACECGLFSSFQFHIKAARHAHTSELYKRVCPSIGWSIGPLVRWSVGLLVRWSVGPWSVSRFAFCFKWRKSRGNGIESLENETWQIWQSSLCNFILVPSFERIFVRTNLLNFNFYFKKHIFCSFDLNYKKPFLGLGN